MADTATTAREVFSVEMVPNGTRGGAFVWVNGECAGRIGVPFWGEADEVDHRLYTASVSASDYADASDERLVGSAAGMTREEARQAVIAAWRTTPVEAVEVAPADHAEAARLAAIAAVDVAITSAVAAGTAPTLIADMRKARGLI